MNEEVITWTMIAAGGVAALGSVLVALGIALGDGLYAVIWTAAGWMIALGLVIGGLAGAVSLLERYSPRK